MKLKLNPFEKVRIELVGNKTLLYAGRYVPDGLWFHCRNCYDKGVVDLMCRVGLGDKFCKNCGIKFDWDHVDKWINPQTKKVEKIDL